MSFLSEVLSSAEKVELEELNKQITEVTSSINNLKTSLTTFLEDIYVHFRERPKRNERLMEKAALLEEELATLRENTANSLMGRTNESKLVMKKHGQNLEKITLIMNIIGVLCKIHQDILTIKELQEDQSSYVLCVKKIIEAEHLVTDNPDLEDLEVFQELGYNVKMAKDSFFSKLANVFKDNILFKTKDGKNVMKINSGEVGETASALYLYNKSVTALHNVARFLWDHIFVPIVDLTCEVNTHQEDNFSVIEIITVDVNMKASYAEVFANIKMVLNFLSANLNFPLTEGINSLMYIGDDIRDNLSELIIKHCLQDTIPSTTEELQQYSVIIQATEDLEQALISSFIFTDNAQSLLVYAKNVDILFINKKCQQYVLMARDLMKKDLHDMVDVGVELQEGYNMTNQFPRCSVSRNILDLIGLMEQILGKAALSPKRSAGQLLNTVRNICTTYSAFVPEYHKKLLQTIPQQVALFHNNCEYLSHKITECNDTYLSRFPCIINKEINDFTGESHLLKEIGSKMFTTHVKGQLSQVEDILKESGLDRQTLELIEPLVEKSIRQCLRQHELLKTVWIKVLPNAVYNKTMGVILNTLCSSLINSIIKFVDISAEPAEQLVELLKMVQTRGPKLFTDPKEVSLYVPLWYKLSELVFVLGASLLDINDRWADGKGPLALQFRPDELKLLIRALFQNTDKRSALLSKIHN